jgi:hypothetical protein
VRLSAQPGIAQNFATPRVIDYSPFFDLFQRTKATETGIAIVEATVSYARGLNDAVHVGHGE